MDDRKIAVKWRRHTEWVLSCDAKAEVQSIAVVHYASVETGDTVNE